MGLKGRPRLRTNPLTRPRILSLIKSILAEGEKDRERAEDIYNLLLERVKVGASNINYSEDLRSLLKSVELLTSSRMNTIKAIESLSKIEAVNTATSTKDGTLILDKNLSGKATTSNIFDLLDRD